MDEGMIRLDSEHAQEFGFTSDKFEGWLWKRDNVITVSFIISRQEGQGHFSRLLNAVWAKGYTIQVPTPLGPMRTILQKKGFQRKAVYDRAFQDWVEIWECAPSEKGSGT